MHPRTHLATALLLAATLTLSLWPAGAQTPSPTSSPPTSGPAGDPGPSETTSPTPPPVEPVDPNALLSLQPSADHTVFAAGDPIAWRYVLNNRLADLELFGFEYVGGLYRVDAPTALALFPTLDLANASFDPASGRLGGVQPGTSLGTTALFGVRGHADFAAVLHAPVGSACELLDATGSPWATGPGSRHPLDPGVYVYHVAMHEPPVAGPVNGVTVFAVAPDPSGRVASVAQPVSEGCAWLEGGGGVTAQQACTGCPLRGYDARGDSGIYPFMEYWPSNCNGGCTPTAFGPEWNYIDTSRPAGITSMASATGALSAARREPHLLSVGLFPVLDGGHHRLEGHPRGARLGEGVGRP